MVSPTAAMRVESGTRVPWLVSTSTVVALVMTIQSNWPSCSSCSALASADGSSALAKLMSGAITGIAPKPRRVAATPSPHLPPRGTSTRQPASGLRGSRRSLGASGTGAMSRLAPSGASSAAPLASSSSATRSASSPAGSRTSSGYSACELVSCSLPSSR